MKKTDLYVGGALVAVIVILLLSGRLMGETGASTWGATDIQCINGHDNLALHIHPQLSILVDGVAEEIPGSVGITAACMAEVHTHDTSGMLHLESATAGETFTLGDFFTVWGQPFEREGYTFEVMANGSSTSNGENLVLRDGQQVVIEYSLEDVAAPELDASGTQ